MAASAMASPVDVENVIVTNGAAHGIWTAMASIVEPGDVVATEALVDTSIITNASILKVRLRGIPLDEQGIIPEALEEAHRRDPIKLLCVTPCYSNPTVSLMGEERRSQIAEIARKHDMLDHRGRRLRPADSRTGRNRSGRSRPSAPTTSRASRRRSRRR